jgi:hypothetical protein
MAGRCSITIPRCSAALASVKLGAQPQQSINTNHTHHHSLHITRTFRLLRIYTSRATIMADSMEGVVVEGEQPKAENVEQKAIAGK